jgi:coproporphyrinogen III oxidase-like Fe-S oxidoreductase
MEQWSEAEIRPSFPDAPGLYIHIPAEVGALGDYFSSPSGHCYVECLKREAQYVGLPEDIEIKTLYIGSAGAGAITQLSASDIRNLLKWLKRRFKLKNLEQSIAEVDAENLTDKKAKALAEGGIDRVACFLPAAEGTEGYLKRKAFAAGIALCREAGVRYVGIDVAAGRPGKSAGVSYLDAEFVLSLKPDAVHLYDLSARTGSTSEVKGKTVTLENLRTMVAERQVERGPDGGGNSAANNLQLFHATEYNATILGLGWGAVSHIRERLSYTPAGACFKYVEALMSGCGPQYVGHGLDMDKERRAHLIRSLEDNGRIDAGTFAQAFDKPPEHYFKEFFNGEFKTGRLKRDGGQIRVTDQSGHMRFMCSLRLYGEYILRALAGAPKSSDYMDPADAALRDMCNPQPVSAFVPEVDAHKGTREVLIDEGVALFGKKDFAGAAARFDRALLLDGKHVPTLLNRGAAAAALGEWTQAVEFYDGAVQGASGGSVKADALSARAEAFLKLGKKKNAYEDLKAALKAAPADWSRRKDVSAQLKKLKS